MYSLAFFLFESASYILEYRHTISQEIGNIFVKIFVETINTESQTMTGVFIRYLRKPVSIVPVRSSITSIKVVEIPATSPICHSSALVGRAHVNKLADITSRLETRGHRFKPPSLYVI